MREQSQFFTFENQKTGFCAVIIQLFVTFVTNDFKGHKMTLERISEVLTDNYVLSMIMWYHFHLYFIGTFAFCFNAAIVTMLQF